MTSSVFIAMFPLQLVIFPGEVLPLHIFEPRYRQLIGECETEGIRFIIPTYVNRNVSQYATEVSLVKVFRRYDDGEMDILVRGERVVRVLDVVETLDDKLYPGARYEEAPFTNDADQETEDELKEKILELARLLQRTSPIGEPTHGSVAFQLAPHVNLNLSQKLTILAMESEQERQEFLLRHVTVVIEKVREKTEGEQHIFGGNGHSNGVSGKHG